MTQEEFVAQFGKALSGDESWAEAAKRAEAAKPAATKEEAVVRTEAPKVTPRPTAKPPPNPLLRPLAPPPSVPLTLAPAEPPPDTRPVVPEKPPAPAPSGMSPQAFDAMSSPVDSLRKAVMSRLKSLAPDPAKMEELQAERGWR